MPKRWPLDAESLIQSRQMITGTKRRSWRTRSTILTLLTVLPHCHYVVPIYWLSTCLLCQEVSSDELIINSNCIDCHTLNLGARSTVLETGQQPVLLDQNLELIHFVSPVAGRLWSAHPLEP
ncbi:hypothetical protein BD779DRAFT_1799488, partial [Infundibulicybe gibba]